MSVCACAASELVGDVPVPWNLPHSVWLDRCHLSQLVDLPHLSLHLELDLPGHCQVSTHTSSFEEVPEAFSTPLQVPFYRMYIFGNP